MAVLKKLILIVCTCREVVVAVLKQLILTVSTFSEGVAVLKELILTVSTLGKCGSLERHDFNTFYFGRKWWS